MPEIGQNLSHYSLVEKIGKGGMGEVYKAKDQKLGRDVAIKVLPEEFAKDTDRVARFQREAKVLASLNHPNIAAIYGLEESGGTNFLVLELVEGDTLADRIKAGPVPVEESLKLALQIAEALEAAHEKGVIHRDLKPANIKVTPDGKVKVLDFGLAKAFVGEQEKVSLSNSPTLSDMATQQGVILGTAAYMSPEQAKGRAVDKRTDIWAFGCVLYEMLTGRVAFRGEDVSEILASVIKGDVKLDLLPANLHPRVREVFIRCLQRDLNRRYQDIREARYEIEQALADPGGLFLQPAAAVGQQKRARTVLPWIAALVLTAITAGVAVWKLKPSEPRQVLRFEYELPEGQHFNGTNSLGISPDGRQFVYSTTKGLYLRSLDGFTAKLIAGTEGRTANPFFSPDGKWIGYYSPADQKLKKISINGGAAVALCDVSRVSGAHWSADDTIVFSTLTEGIMRVSANGGTPQALFKPKSGFIISDPQILPDGKSVLYTAVSDGSLGQQRVMVQSIKSGDPKELFAGFTARYLSTGHIVYAVGNNLFAVPFNPDTLEIKGAQVPIVEDVLSTNASKYALSDSGTLAYLPGKSATGSVDKRTLVWVDRNGKEEPLTAQPNAYAFPRISPDGTRIALTIGGAPNSNIWIWDLARKTWTRLTLEESTDIAPLWTLDGKRIAFSAIVKGKNSVRWKAADGTGKDESLDSLTDRLLYPSSWSRDAKAMILEETTGATAFTVMAALPAALAATAGWSLRASTNTSSDIGVLSMEGDRAVKPLLQGKFAEVHPQISPDGRWIAYASYESGQFEVYVSPFPQVDDGRWTISTSGGEQPRWSPDGRELFYRSGDAMMVVPVNTEPTFKVGTPTRLFHGAYYSLIGRMWDVSPDGKRFLMIRGEPTSGETSTPETRQRINIVLNWTEELKQRVPIK